jgi:hypothetical protein
MESSNKASQTVKVEEQNQGASPSSYMSYSTGGKVGDGVIEKVFSKSKTHAVYKIKNKRGFSYSFHPQAYDEHVHAHVNNVSTLRSLATKKLKGVIDPHLQAMMIKVFGSIFGRQNDDLVLPQIEEIKRAVNELRETKQIIGVTNDYIVWIDADSEVHFHVCDTLTGVRQSIAEFTTLRSKSSAMLNEENFKSFNKRLGATLVKAFETKPSDPTIVFNKEDDYLNSLLSNDIKAKYLVSATVITSFMIAMVYCMYTVYTGITLPTILHKSLIPVSAGFLGAYISVLERAKTFQINENDSLNLLLLQVGSRLILGGVFGLIAYLASVTNLAFGLLNKSNESLIVLGIIGGFSERFIPELIESFTDSKGDKQH